MVVGYRSVVTQGEHTYRRNLPQGAIKDLTLPPSGPAHISC